MILPVIHNELLIEKNSLLFSFTFVPDNNLHYQTWKMLAAIEAIPRYL